MKYVVLQMEFQSGDVREIPIIFPNTLVHKDVAELLCTHIQRELRAVVSPVAAGFINSVQLGQDLCFGESDSLLLKSRGKEDDRLIQMYDYHHGIK